MGLGVHGGRRVRMGTENEERERESRRWLAGWQWSGEREGLAVGWREKVLTSNHRSFVCLFVFFFFFFGFLISFYY